MRKSVFRLGERRLAVVGPKAWKSLLARLHQIRSTVTFKRHLNSVLFQRAYTSWYVLFFIILVSVSLFTAVRVLSKQTFIIMIIGLRPSWRLPPYTTGHVGFCLPRVSPACKYASITCCNAPPLEQERQLPQTGRSSAFVVNHHHAKLGCCFS